MEVDWGLVIVFVIVTCLSSTGLFSFIQFLLNRKSSMKKDIDELKIACSRLQLTSMLQNDPKNEDAILKEAEHYFHELKADGYMHNELYKWSKKYDVDISWLMNVKERKEQLWAVVANVRNNSII